MEKLVEMVKQHEGFREKPYKDTVDKLTIGFGWNLEDTPLNPFIAELILRDHILNTEIKLMNYDWFRMQNRVRKDALIDMAVNMGVGGLLKFKRMIACLYDKDYTGAKSEALDSKWAGQVGVRAHRISSMLESGEY